jgi:hypothetical protein
MHPFPPGDQLNFLVGAELGSITIHPYSIDFRFVDGTGLTAEQGIEYVDEHGHRHTHAPQDHLGPDPLSFHALLQDRIAQVRVEAYHLTLVFESGRRLTVLSEAGPYESGQIWRGGKRLIVF